jgi:hypothetical protein
MSTVAVQPTLTCRRHQSANCALRTSRHPEVQHRDPSLHVAPGHPVIHEHTPHPYPHEHLLQPSLRVHNAELKGRAVGQDSSQPSL